MFFRNIYKLSGFTYQHFHIKEVFAIFNLFYIFFSKLCLCISTVIVSKTGFAKLKMFHRHGNELGHIFCQMLESFNSKCYVTLQIFFFIYVTSNLVNPHILLFLVAEFLFQEMMGNLMFLVWASSLVFAYYEMIVFEKVVRNFQYLHRLNIFGEYT